MQTGKRQLHTQNETVKQSPNHRLKKKKGTRKRGYSYSKVLDRYGERGERVASVQV